jgi:hypothetical protein
MEMRFNEALRESYGLQSRQFPPASRLLSPSANLSFGGCCWNYSHVEKATDDLTGDLRRYQEPAEETKTCYIIDVNILTTTSNQPRALFNRVHERPTFCLFIY